MSVYFYGCISIDGYLADANHNLEWLDESGSVEETSYDAFYKEMDITIMGKKTYDAIKHMANIESFYATTQNYVFTHQNEKLLDSFESAQGDICRFVREIKGKNVWIVGGNTLLAPLIDADMIDVFIIQVAPVLLGKGIPLFTQAEAQKRYILNEVNRYGQFAELVYTRD